MKPLSPRQSEILQFVIDTINARGFPPSTREIADKLGVSSSHGIFLHLKAMEAKGYVKRWPHSGLQVLAFPDGAPAAFRVLPARPPSTLTPAEFFQTIFGETSDAE